MFSKDFVWGAATAAYQVEGAYLTDGRAPSVWDVFSHTNGKTRDGHTGDVACDHYHRYAEDVALMQAMSLGGYRFSVSWSRVLPGGTGAPNEKGLDFYDRLIDALLAHGIKPYLTLFHWDYPDALYQRGGWMNPDSAKWFGEYASLLTRRFSDRVTNWMTLNEPQCFINIGHHHGTHAPGLRLEGRDLALCVHNTLLAHGTAVEAIRAGAKETPRIGLASCTYPVMPQSDSAADLEAARRATFRTGDLGMNADWLDPIFLGQYPAFLAQHLGAPSAAMQKTIASPLDFLGLNIYQGGVVKAGADGAAIPVPHKVGHARTAINWPQTPDCLYWGVRLFYERYQVPISITENGMANCDVISLDGQCHDPQRIDYLHRHLAGLKRAAAEEIPVESYFQWSLLDNFEWAEGYNERFGLVYVDFETQERIPKDSAEFYRRVASSNGAIL